MKDFGTLSFSSIKEFNKSPLHFLTYKNKQKKTTPAMRFGSVVHKLVLEFNDFTNRYAVAPECDRRTTVGKNAWAQFVELSEGKEVLTTDEMNAAIDIKHAIERHPVANKIVQHCGQREIHFETELFGHKIHGFADGIGDGLVFDLKTTQRADERGFGRVIVDESYYIQAAIYASAFGVDEFRFVAVETNAPYMVGTYRLGPEWIDAGLAKLESILEKYDRWDGSPVGYNDNKLVTIDVPPFLAI
jgi:exodeoxyribonuclease VIII